MGKHNQRTKPKCPDFTALADFAGMFVGRLRVLRAKLTGHPVHNGPEVDSLQQTSLI